MNPGDIQAVCLVVGLLTTAALIVQHTIEDMKQ